MVLDVWYLYGTVALRTLWLVSSVDYLCCVYFLALDLLVDLLLLIIVVSVGYTFLFGVGLLFSVCVGYFCLVWFVVFFECWVRCGACSWIYLLWVVVLRLFCGFVWVVCC